jgi:succinyl-CoA synthetase beta subunit
MNFEEHAAKALILRPAGIPIPRGILCTNPSEAAAAAGLIGPCIVKAQVAAGKRGKAGGIKRAGTPAQAATAADELIGMQIDGLEVERVLVEECAVIAREFYAAVLNDTVACKPVILFSAEGGMDIEDTARARPDSMRRMHVETDRHVSARDIVPMLDGLGLGSAEPVLADILRRLYEAYRRGDAELLEVNPLALLVDGRVLALDCKFVLDDAAAYRQEALASAALPEQRTELERRGHALGLKYIQLAGDVGVLANGAGLTMATMDVIRHLGGRPANFLEIGGEAYTKSAAAFKLVLSHPGVRSLMINFCGAFARTDVMAEGVVQAWRECPPGVPVFFSIHGTGEDRAIALIRNQLGVEPYDDMEDAVRHAIRSAR